jgi:hypothetical protein
VSILGARGLLLKEAFAATHCTLGRHARHRIGLPRGLRVVDTTSSLHFALLDFFFLRVELLERCQILGLLARLFLLREHCFEIFHLKFVSAFLDLA